VSPMPGGRIEPAAQISGPPPLLWLAWVCAVATIIYVIGAPFWAAEYPMMTDFPFHAASSSIFRHYLDAGWHFREQFVFPEVNPEESIFGFPLAVNIVPKKKDRAAALELYRKLGVPFQKEKQVVA